MSRVTTISRYGWKESGSRMRPKDRGHSDFLSVKRAALECVGKEGKKWTSAAAYLIILIALSGAFYLYQVNDLATKGFEIKELEQKIGKLRKDRKNIAIKEVELKSMYNLEKVSANLETINPASVSYIDLNGPVAMK